MACPVVVTERKAVGPRNSFWLNLCIAARAWAPYLELRGPFCAVINVSGPLHFHPTARRCTARRQDECIAPSSPTCRSSVPRPIRSRVCKSDRVDMREKDARNESGKNEREEILSLYICRHRTIVGKIITVFTAERIHCRASESAPPSKVDRQVSSTFSARALLTRSKVR